MSYILEHIRNLCRICLDTVKFPEYTDLFSDKIESKEILHKLNVCFQIVFNFEQNLSPIMCLKCIKELDNANNFRVKCITANERLKKYLERIPNNTMIESSPVINMEQDLLLDTSSKIEQLKSPSELTEDSLNEFLSDQDNVKGNNELSDQNKLKCVKCDKVLKSKKTLLKHVVSMHENRQHAGRVVGFGPNRRYHCTNCSYSTPHSQTLINHMRRHSNERPFTCECGKSFTQASSLAAHRKIHSNTTYFTCTVCGKQFKHAFSLKTHLRVHESGIFSCTKCNKVLKSKTSLYSHIKRHYCLYDYNCEDCGDMFATSAELLNHRKKHLNWKNIQCNICDYKTNSKKSLAIHLKRHIGEKAYSCDFCTKSFFTQDSLKRHTRVHTREKPFSCHTCAQRFAYSSSLNKHMLTVHGEQYKWGDAKKKESRANKKLT